jgi:hypothetical protein
MASLTAPRSSDRRKWFPRVVKIILVIIVVLAVFRVVVASGFLMQVNSGGCNHIPLVNGHPQYQCGSQPGK